MLSVILQFWGATLTLLLVLLELLARLVDKNKKTKNLFEFEKMPVMQPIKIPTAGVGVAKALWTWVSKTREWEIVEDFHYTLNGVNYIVPAGFICDGSSIPKFLRVIVSPTGILLIGSIVHDYSYAKGCLMLASGEFTQEYSQRRLDRLFRDINIQVNGFRTINNLAYYILRTVGFFMWYTHRGRNKVESLKKNV